MLESLGSEGDDQSFADRAQKQEFIAKQQKAQEVAGEVRERLLE